MADQFGVERINGFGDSANIDITKRYVDMGDGTHAEAVAQAPIGIQFDAGGRVRVGQLTTLGDYKSLGYEHSLLWENAGTGTGVVDANKFNMSVTAGQWFVKSTRWFHQYFSGKSQVVELTFDNFQPQSGVIKRCGYFSSSVVSPYSATLDGVWLESDGETIRLICSRAGVETLNVALEDWSGYSTLEEYKNAANWKNFTVILIDFLWLGGAILRLSMMTSKGFRLAHQFVWAGTAPDVFMLSPNQPIRHEIRSSSGSGSFRYICAQVSTEGAIEESGHSHGIDCGHVDVTYSLVGTKYPVKAVSRQSAYRDIVIKLSGLDLLVDSINDRVLWTLECNPTLSGALSYSNVPNSALREADGDGNITVAATGTIIASGYHIHGSKFPETIFEENILAYLGQSLDGTQDQLVLCITPMTASISAVGAMGLKEY
jgi:hypothetical protein